MLTFTMDNCSSSYCSFKSSSDLLVVLEDDTHCFDLSSRYL
jgi:hypothetical protein